MTIQAKLGIAALTLGSGGVATYAALVPKVSGTEIKKIIDEEFRYVLLNTEDETKNKDDAEWEAKWESYKKDNTKNTFELDEWDQKGSKNLKDKLRQKCGIFSKREVPNKADQIYQDVIKYCTRDVTIADHSTRDKLNLIDTKGDAVDATWTKMVGADQKGKWTKDFENLDIKPVSTGAGVSSTVNAEEVKKKWGEAIKKHKGQDKYDEIYASYKKVCTKQKTKEE